MSRTLTHGEGLLKHLATTMSGHAGGDVVAFVGRQRETRAERHADLAAWTDREFGLLDCRVFTYWTVNVATGTTWTDYSNHTRTGILSDPPQSPLAGPEVSQPYSYRDACLGFLVTRQAPQPNGSGPNSSEAARPRGRAHPASLLALFAYLRGPPGCVQGRHTDRATEPLTSTMIMKIPGLPEVPLLRHIEVRPTP